MALFTDLSTGRILQAVEGKGKEDNLPFMKKLARKAKNLFQTSHYERFR
jgi:hypothetical protein